MTSFVAFFAASSCVPSIEAFCTKRVLAECEYEKRCGFRSASGDCSQLTVSCFEDRRSAITLGVVRYDAIAAQQCLDAHTTRACGSAQPTVCEVVVTGTRQRGERCGYCARGLRCESATGACGVCVDDTAGVNAEPSGPRADLDEACTNVNDCRVDLTCRENRCVRRSTARGECTRHDDCVSNVCLISMNLQTWAISSSGCASDKPRSAACQPGEEPRTDCIRVRRHGESCSSASCEAGAVCDANDICRNPAIDCSQNP